VLDDFHHVKPGATEGNRSSVPVFIDTGATLVDKSNAGSFTPTAPATK
jgi:hypothetical protein